MQSSDFREGRWYESFRSACCTSLTCWKPTYNLEGQSSHFNYWKIAKTLLLIEDNSRILYLGGFDPDPHLIQYIPNNELLLLSYYNLKRLLSCIMFSQSVCISTGQTAEQARAYWKIDLAFPEYAKMTKIYLQRLLTLIRKFRGLDLSKNWIFW